MHTTTVACNSTWGCPPVSAVHVVTELGLQVPGQLTINGNRFSELMLRRNQTQGACWSEFKLEKSSSMTDAMISVRTRDHCSAGYAR